MVMRANLRMPQSVAAAIAGSQAVVNATGIFFPRGRQRYRTVHVDGAGTVASACRTLGVERLVHISGIGAETRMSQNPYIRSKADGEQAVISAFETATFLRPSVVFGANDQLFNRMAGIAAKAPFMPVVGGKTRVQPVFVGDVAAAAAAVLARPETARTVFELGGPLVYTYRELAALTLREIDRKKPIIDIPAGLMKIAAFFAQQSALLGLTPPITVDQVELMRHDNVVSAGAPSLQTLGIQPTAPESILPTYLDRFRIDGRYNQHAPA
jgi:NADH dehydrogenase